MKKVLLSLVLILGSTSTVLAQRQGGGNGNGQGNGQVVGGIGSATCRADMIAKNNTVITSFTGNNCQQALRQCQVDLQRRQNQGLNPHAICQTANNNGGGQRPPPPPPPVQNDYGPAQTVRWQDFGSTKLDKVVIERITIRANNSYVNEILLRASGSDIRIERVAIILTSGQIYHLPHQAGIISDNREVRLRLDQRYSLRVSHIEIEASTAGLFGSRGRLQTILGLAY